MSRVIDEWCNFTPNLPRPRSTELNPKNEAKQRNLLSLAASLPVEDRVLSMLQDIFDWKDVICLWDFVGMYVVADMTSLSCSSLSSSLPLFVTCSSPFRKEQHGSRNIQYRVYLYLTRSSVCSSHRYGLLVVSLVRLLLAAVAAGYVWHLKHFKHHIYIYQTYSNISNIHQTSMLTGCSPPWED